MTAAELRVAQARQALLEVGVIQAEMLDLITHCTDEAAGRHALAIAVQAIEQRQRAC
ncbi:hypothetical protein [Cryobacterium melibiosiphilum]|uniref:hypothetical protein n=1 Tax=Cryobacterium melibiosiphilum TaxID=995039 RepID=UPI001314384C|nr:hypothetical protein [Cryobacterium melibiosiphilum]